MSELEHSGSRGTQAREERHAQIIDLLARQEIASLAELQEATEASQATVRRDLTALREAGLVERTRGGARVVRRDSSLDEAFGRRRRRRAHAKGRIAVAAADLVPPGSSIFVNDGSTAFALAAELAGRHPDLWVATTGLNIAEALSRSESAEVVMIGGSLRGTSFGTVGPLATLAVRGLSADLAFLGCDGLDQVGGVRSNNLLDAEVARTMAAQAKLTVVIADSSKIGNAARTQVIPWEEVDWLVTDALDAEFKRTLKEVGVRAKLA